MLTGLVPNLQDIEVPSSYQEKEYKSLSQGEKFLAQALHECYLQLKQNDRVNIPEKSVCFLGATADGSKEYDEALLYENLSLLDPKNNKWQQTLEKIFHCKQGDYLKYSPETCYKKVVHTIFSNYINTYLIDAACASSLYTIDLGMKNLQSFESDFVLAGGVFAPGPANSCLFFAI